MTKEELMVLIQSAKAKYEAMEPKEKAEHDYEQRRSFIRGMCPSKRDYKAWCDMVDRVLPPIGRDGETSAQKEG